MRIYKADLNRIVDRLNMVTRGTTDRVQPNGRYVLKGAYDLDWRDGGAMLIRHTGNYFGDNSVLWGGYTTKRECYMLVEAYLRGIEEGSK